jgi:hypothetical protein
MAHTVLWIDGFDEIASTDQKYSSTERNQTWATDPTPAYGYGKAMRVQNGWVAPILTGSPYTVLFAAFDLLLYTTFDVSQLQLEFWDDLAGQAQCYLKTSLNQSALKYDLVLYRGATALYTWTAVLDHAIHNHVSIRCEVNSSTGSVTLAVNGVDKGTFTGNTQNTTNTRIDRFRINMTVNNSRVGVDNWVIASGLITDPLLPVTRVYGANMPNANIAVAWTPSTGSNYQTVDEIPPSDTDYNSTSTSGAQDVFSHAALSGVGDQVLAVRANARAWRDSTDTIQNLVRVSGTDYYGSTKTPSSSYLSYGHVWAQNPATSAAWTPSDAIAAQFGYRRV